MSRQWGTVSRRNKARCAQDRDALSRTKGLGRTRQCDAVLRHDERGLACPIDQAKGARQGTMHATKIFLLRQTCPVATKKKNLNK